MSIKEMMDTPPSVLYEIFRRERTERFYKFLEYSFRVRR